MTHGPDPDDGPETLCRQRGLRIGGVLVDVGPAAVVSLKEFEYAEIEYNSKLHFCSVKA